MDPQSPLPPPGWIVVLGELVEDGSVRGALARREDIQGFCQRPGCWRRCEVDLAHFARRGFGGAPLDWAKRTLSCGNMDGCKLEFTPRNGRVLRLEDLCVPGVTVRFRCLGCGANWSKTPRQLIGHIRAKARTDERFKAVGTLAQLRAAPMGPCKGCGKTLWTVEVRWPARPPRLTREEKALIDHQRR